MEEAGDGAKASGEDARGGGTQAQGMKEQKGFVVSCLSLLWTPKFEITLITCVLKTYTKGIAGAWI